MNFKETKKYGILLGCTLLILLLTSLVYGATYYVSTSGNDAYSGTSNQPFRTIQHAADIAQSGDKVKVRAGVYYERIELKNSGTPESPIVFEGTRGSGGEWLTIIDGSDATSGWVAAPEVGTGVYKKDLGYVPYAMILDGDKNIARIHEDYGRMFAVLRRAADATYESKYSRGEVPLAVSYWDGIEAYFGYKAGMTYISIEDGGDGNPNNRNVRSSPGGGHLGNCWNCWPPGQAVLINDVSYNTIKDFVIRGARYSVFIRGSGAYNNIIEDSKLMNGQGRIWLVDGTHDNIIRNNDMENNMLGFEDYPPGAWGRQTNQEIPTDYEYESLVKFGIYKNLKYVSKGASGIKISSAGGNNVINGNNIHDGFVGIKIFRTSDTKVYGNKINNMCSTGIVVFDGVFNTDIYDNTLYNGNANMRLEKLERGGRLVGIYRNEFSLPPYFGKHIYLHVSVRNVTPSNIAQIDIYNNKFSGANKIITKSGWLDNGLISDISIFNNIISAN